MSATTDEPTVICPFCGSTDTERYSRFGQEISKEGYICNDCLSPFEYMKYDGRRPDAEP